MPGTPSFLSTSQLQGLVDRLQAIQSWDDAEEITFECEPGTLTEPKLIKEAFAALEADGIAPDQVPGKPTS